jgi:hypothetical protein
MEEKRFLSILKKEFERLRWNVKITDDGESYILDRKFRDKRRKLLIFQKWITLYVSYSIFHEWIKDTKTKEDQEFLIKTIKQKLRGKK